MLDDKTIMQVIEIMQSNQLPGFINNDCFIQLAIPLIKMLREPGFDSLNNVKLEIEQCGVQLIQSIYEAFPNLLNLNHNQFIKILNKQEIKTKEVLEYIYMANENYIYTKNPNFILSTQRVKENVQNIQQQAKPKPIIQASLVNAQTDSKVNINLQPKTNNNFDMFFGNPKGVSKKEEAKPQASQKTEQSQEPNENEPEKI